MKIRLTFIATLLLCASVILGKTEHPTGALHVLTVTGPINPVTKDYILDGLGRAKTAGASAVLIRLDTPGGLLDATRDIIQGMLNAPFPVIVYVAPPGARAASAGVFITMAADVAAMAPLTHLGAAHPVNLGGGSPLPASPKENGKEDGTKENKQAGSVMEEKMVSDTAAYARTLAQTKGRNADWAERAVRESVSLTSEEAVKNNVIDVVAENEAVLFEKLEGRVLTKEGMSFTLHLAPSARVEFKMGLLRRWLTLIAHPNVAYLLLVLGFYALVYEFSTPGIGLGAIAGIVCLVLAFFSLQVLPLNYAGLILLVAGIIMMGLDIIVSAHGLLIFGGILSFALGSFFLFDINQTVFRVSVELILALVLSTAGFFGVVVRKIWIARKKRPVTGAEGLVGQTADVREEGLVFVDGALWSANGTEGMSPGEKVRVVQVIGNQLKVVKEA